MELVSKGGGFARNGAQKPAPLFFGAGLLAEVPKSLLGSMKIPSFPKVYKVFGDLGVLHFIKNIKFS